MFHNSLETREKLAIAPKPRGGGRESIEFPIRWVLRGENCCTET